MTSRRYELTDFEWSIIAPLLPNKPRGVPRVDESRVNGIFWFIGGIHLPCAAGSLAMRNK